MNLESKLVKKYMMVFWVKNYIKTMTATTLVSSGVGLLITGELTRFHNHGWSNAEIILGIVCVVLAIIVTYVLDYWSARKDREIINDIDTYIDERAEEIAEELVLKHLNEIAEKEE